MITSGGNCMTLEHGDTIITMRLRRGRYGGDQKTEISFLSLNCKYEYYHEFSDCPSQ